MKIWLENLCMLCILTVTGLGEDCNQKFVYHDSGKIMSPNYPNPFPDNAFCNYHIRVREGEHVQFNISDMSCSADTTHDFLLLFDGKDCMSKRIAAITQTTTWPVVTQSNYLTALFVSDDAITDKGFQGNFAVVPYASPARLQRSSLYFTPRIGELLMACGGELPDKNLTFQVPPSTRLPNVCIWRITAKRHQKINVTISNTQVFSRNNWLRVLDGGSCDKKTILYVHSVTDNKDYSAQSTKNQVIIFAVRQRGLFGQSPYTITYTLTSPPSTALKPLSELKFYYVPETQAPSKSVNSKTGVMNMFVTLAAVSFIRL